MKKEIADKWVRALRSGEYKQGNGSLLRDGNYCCLGVLCDLALKNNVPITVGIVEGATSFDGKLGVLPNSVKNWAGMNSANGGLFASHRYTSLTDENDLGVNFNEIAKLIADHWDNL